MTVPYSEMSEADIEAFLAEPRFAVFGTHRQDGSPQQSPVWYLFEEGKLYVSVMAGSIKHKHLLRDPRLSVCIAGTHPDARAVMMRGPVELVPEDGTAWVEQIAWKIIRRYYDSDEEAQDYVDSTAGPGESMLVVLTPERIVAQDYN